MIVCKNSVYFTLIIIHILFLAMHFIAMKYGDTWQKVLLVDFMFSLIMIIMSPFMLHMFQGVCTT